MRSGFTLRTILFIAVSGVLVAFPSVGAQSGSASTSTSRGLTPTSREPYTGVTPFRVCDTRASAAANQCNDDSTGAGMGPIGPGATRAITVEGFGGVPASGVTAVVVNITAIAPTAATGITLYPTGGSAPYTANLDLQAGAVVANLVEVGVGTGGAINVYNHLGSVDVAVDIEGYVSSASTGLFNPTAPTRICDTRAAGPGIAANQCDASGASPILAGGTLTFSVSGSGSPIPAEGVAAVVFNLTAIGATTDTALTVYAGNTTRPSTSNINVDTGITIANRVIVLVSPQGTVSISNGAGLVNVAVDVDGWFTTSASTGPVDALFTGLDSKRVCNTRRGDEGDAGCLQGLLEAGQTLHIAVAGISGVPPIGPSGSPVAVVLNVTVLGATAPTYLTIFSGSVGVIRPPTSDISVSSKSPIANLVVVEVGTNGTIDLYNALGGVYLIVDVLGYYN
jgi:hypothetical protein